MPKSVTTEMADAIKTSLNGGVFSLPFVALRSRRPKFNLKDLEALRVSVVAIAIEEEMANNTRKRGLHKVQVWVQQRVNSTSAADGIDDAKFDDLDYLCQQIDDNFSLKRLPGYENAVWNKSERKPLYWPAHLERGVFTGVITLTYSLVR